MTTLHTSPVSKSRFISVINGFARYSPIPYLVVLFFSWISRWRPSEITISLEKNRKLHLMKFDVCFKFPFWWWSSFIITRSNLFGYAVTYRSRLIQFSKLINATAVSKILLHNLHLRRLSGDDVITYISVVFELRRFLSAVLRERLFNFGSIERNW